MNRLEDAHEYQPSYRARFEDRVVVVIGPVPGEPEHIGLFMWSPSGQTMQDEHGAPALVCHASAFEESQNDPETFLAVIAEDLISSDNLQDVAVVFARPLPLEGLTQ